MDFTLSPEQRGVQEKAQRLAREAKVYESTNEIMRLIIVRDLRPPQ